MNHVPFRKILAILVAVILPLALAPSSVRSEISDAPASTLPISSISVPEDLGKVSERFVGSSPRTVIQIQDVHAHAVAQQNIAAILERLRTVFGIETAALEGAWSSTALPKSHAIPTSREKQLLAGTLLEDDRISGPVYAAIMSPDAITLVGVENEALYEKNRQLFLDHLVRAPAIREKLNSYGKDLHATQQASWNAALFGFSEAFGTFRETSDFSKFLPLLLKTAEAGGTLFSDLSQVLLLKDILALEKSFEKERLEKEVKQVIKKYKDRPWTVEELIRGGKIPPEEIGLYPEIKKLTRLYKMRDDLSLRELMDQIGTLTGRVLETLIKSPEERTLWEKTGRFYLAQRLLLLQATPSDLNDYDRAKPPLEIELDKAGLSDALALSVSFYEIVKKRDGIFFERIMNDPTLTGNVAIVTGGFHTDGLSQKFRDAGISYITITPDLGGTPVNEKLYNDRMAEPSRYPVSVSPRPGINGVEGQTLSELRDAPVRAELRFPPTYEFLRQARNILKAIRFYDEEPLAVSDTDKIAHLAREKMIVPVPTMGTSLSASSLRVDEFMAKPRSEQREIVRGWLSQILGRKLKAMLVSSVSILATMLPQEGVVKHLEEAVQSGDIIALAQDIPASEMPEALLSTHGIDLFDAPDIKTLVAGDARFAQLIKKRPFAIMEDGRLGGKYVVLPEKPISLVLFRIVTMNPSLYQAARDPAFLTLLEDLANDILSRELPKKSV